MPLAHDAKARAKDDGQFHFFEVVSSTRDCLMPCVYGTGKQRGSFMDASTGLVSKSIAVLVAKLWDVFFSGMLRLMATNMSAPGEDSFSLYILFRCIHVVFTCCIGGLHLFLIKRASGDVHSASETQVMLLITISWGLLTGWAFQSTITDIRNKGSEVGSHDFAWSLLFAILVTTFATFTSWGAGKAHKAYSIGVFQQAWLDTHPVFDGDEIDHNDVGVIKVLLDGRIRYQRMNYEVQWNGNPSPGGATDVTINDVTEGNPDSEGADLEGGKKDVDRGTVKLSDGTSFWNPEQTVVVNVDRDIVFNGATYRVKWMTAEAAPWEHAKCIDAMHRPHWKILSADGDFGGEVIIYRGSNKEAPDAKLTFLNPVETHRVPMVQEFFKLVEACMALGVAAMWDNVVYVTVATLNAPAVSVSTGCAYGAAEEGVDVNEWPFPTFSNFTTNACGPPQWVAVDLNPSWLVYLLCANFMTMILVSFGNWIDSNKERRDKLNFLGQLEAQVYKVANTSLGFLVGWQWKRCLDAFFGSGNHGMGLIGSGVYGWFRAGQFFYCIIVTCISMYVISYFSSRAKAIDSGDDALDVDDPKMQLIVNNLKFEVRQSKMMGAAFGMVTGWSWAGFAVASVRGTDGDLTDTSSYSTVQLFNMYGIILITTTLITCFCCGFNVTCIRALASFRSSLDTPSDKHLQAPNLSAMRSISFKKDSREKQDKKLLATA